MKDIYDVVIVGAGVIGVAVAKSLVERRANLRVAVVEKERTAGLHTSGRNSGVIHAGFNLKPGTLKARFCLRGNAELRAFCEQCALPFQAVGTVVVAQDREELGRLEQLYQQGVENGVPGIRMVNPQGLAQLEPYARGVAALHAPSGAITCGQRVTQALVLAATEKGCRFFFHQRVRRIEDHCGKYTLWTSDGPVACRYLINCAGLYADEVAHQVGVGLDYLIVPFRGEYYRLRPEKRGVLRSMVYPVPNLVYPFLGVHWTRTVSDEVLIGPNATIAWGREAYHPFQVHMVETLQMVTHKNFWNLLRSRDFRRLAWDQLCLSWNKRAFVQAAQRLIPNVTEDDFLRGQSGNRAQVVDAQGCLVEDILVQRTRNSLHILNAVSPGFTCALPFAEYVVETLMN